MYRFNGNALVVLAAYVVPLAVFVTGAPGQELQFAAQQGPYYVGEPLLVQVTASGYQETDNPQCRLKNQSQDGITIAGPQVGQSRSSFTQIINGRVSRRESIDYRFSFVVTAHREGEFEVGPFEVDNNGGTETVAGSRFRFVKLEPDPDMEIGFSAPSSSIYIGQQVPITIRWAYAGDIETVQHAFSNLQIRSPLFDQFSFREEPRRSRTTLSIATAKGNIDVDAQVSQEEKDGKKFIVVTGQRTLMADAAGEFKDIPITCRTTRVTRWGRDLFGDKVARASAPSLAAGLPLDLVVKPIPLSNRPPSFAGAVGKGFSVEVAANRSVVRVGDPISLTISVRGDGNLDSMSLPPLNAANQLSDQQFQVPTEPQAGTLDGNTKQFSVTVRVKDQSVTKIPAIAFSWFDPDREEFATTHSKPIALQVMDTKIISSADVVSGPQNQNGNGSQIASDGSEAANESGLSFSGANLAIETNPAVLLASTDNKTFMAFLPGVIYALAFIVALVVLAGRRSKSDLAESRRKRQLAGLRKSIQNASSLESKAALAKIGADLRDVIRLFEPQNRSAIEQIISDCDNATYARTDGATEQVQSVAQRSLTEIDLVAKELTQ